MKRLALEIVIPDDCVPIVIGGTIVLLSSQGATACAFYDPRSAAAAQAAGLKRFGTEVPVSYAFAVKAQLNVLAFVSARDGLTLEMADTPGDPS